MVDNARTVEPLVSVVVAFYDKDDFLVDAVRSVESQTYGNFEIVVVDDCSPGLSASELLDWRGTERLRIVRPDSNGGLGNTRNLGVRSSCGDLVVHLDADDALEPEFLARTVAALCGGEHAGVYTDVRAFGMLSETWSGECSLPRSLVYGAPSTFIYRRDVFDDLGGYKESLRLGADKDFWLRALARGWRFYHLREPLYNYRIHPQGHTSSPGFGRKVMKAMIRENGDLFRANAEDAIALSACRLAAATRKARTIAAEFQRLQELNATYRTLHAEPRSRFDRNKVGPLDQD